MVKRKDAAQPAAKSPATTPPTAKVAPPQQRPPAAGGVAEQQQPSKFRFATLLFRIASLAFALYTLYKRMYPPPSTVDLDLDNKARIRHAPIERDPLRQDAVLEAFKVSFSSYLASSVNPPTESPHAPQHSYRAYEKDAFGSDELRNISIRYDVQSPLLTDRMTPQLPSDIAPRQQHVPGRARRILPDRLARLAPPHRTNGRVPPRARLGREAQLRPRRQVSYLRGQTCSGDFDPG
jgi:hypothetical protein